MLGWMRCKEEGANRGGNRDKGYGGGKRLKGIDGIRDTDANNGGRKFLVVIHLIHRQY